MRISSRSNIDVIGNLKNVDKQYKSIKFNKIDIGAGWIP